MPTLGLSSLRFPVIKEPVSELFVVGVDTFTDGFDFDTNRINVSDLTAGGNGGVQIGDTLVFFVFAGQDQAEPFPDIDFNIIDSAGNTYGGNADMNPLWFLSSTSGAGDDLYSMAIYYDVVDLNENFRLDGVSNTSSRVAESSTLLFVVTLRNSSRKDISQATIKIANDASDLAETNPPAQLPTTDGALIIHVAAIGSDRDNVLLSNTDLDGVVSLYTQNAQYQSAAAAIGFHTWTAADGSYSPGRWIIDWQGSADGTSAAFLGAVTFRPNV